MTPTCESVQPALDYLKKFFASHHREHQRVMLEAGGAKYGNGEHGEQFVGHNAAIECIRRAVHLAEASFSKLEVPGGFPTPKAFVETVVAYQGMFEKDAHDLESLNAQNKGTWPGHLGDAHKISSNCRDAMAHAIELIGLTIEAPALERLQKLLRHLPRVSRMIRKSERHATRETLEITDEYDVQDLLRGVLQLEFDDIRPEVWALNFGGTSSRVDFLLATEGILIEAKHTKDKYAQKKIVDELIIDISKYKDYPRVKHLVCAIWDTEHHLTNAAALKTDLEKQNEGFVTVVVMS